MKEIGLNKSLSKEDKSFLNGYKNMLVPATHPGGTSENCGPVNLEKNKIWSRGVSS